MQSASLWMSVAFEFNKMVPTILCGTETRELFGTEQTRQARDCDGGRTIGS